MSGNHPDPFDITLVVKDGKEFHAHRNVLSQASPFFQKLLNIDMKENNEGIIRLEWIIESQMADILQFIYTGNVQISAQDNAENLIHTADYLLLPMLKSIAGKFVEQHMTTVNCISIYYSIAEQYSCEELIASTRKFINSNFTTVAASDQFLNLPSHEVEKWISSNDIVIDAEENVFEIILRWIDHEKSERSEQFGELFRHVRLTTVSRDILLSDVVTNEFVKENKDCLESVTAALEWFDQSTDCDVPRPHCPRKALETGVVVFLGIEVDWESASDEPSQISFYLPGTDELYRLPAHKYCSWNTRLFSCRRKVFVVTDNIAESQCYDPDLNRWSPAPWTMDANEEFISNISVLTHSLQDVLVVRNKICFIVRDGTRLGCTYTLWTYNLDANSMAVPLFDWIQELRGFCLVAVDKYIYIVGGTAEVPPGREEFSVALSECARFDTEGTWQAIAPLNEARTKAFGVSKNEKIFIAGGTGSLRELLNSCEVYNISTDEWQAIASLTVPRVLGIVLLVDETLYLLVEEIRKAFDSSINVECYDPEKDEWKNRADIPLDKIIKMETLHGVYHLRCCSLSALKDVLSNLESIS